MALKLKGSTSGFVAIDAPSVAGNNTLILPENTGSAHQILANDITAGVTTFTQVTVSRNGDLTVPGTISIGGTLTYEDVTSVDSVGIVTARGLSIFGNTTGLQVASGISTFQAVTGTTGTFSGDISISNDTGRINLGASADLKLYHDGNNSKIVHSGGGNFIIEAAGSDEDVTIQATDDVFIKVQGSENSIRCIGDGAVELYYDNSKKFETTSSGVNIASGNLQITPSAAGSKFLLMLTGVNGHANMGGSTGNHGCRYFFGMSINGGSFVSVTTGNAFSTSDEEPLASTHIQGALGNYFDFPVDYSYVATPTYSLGNSISFRPYYGKNYAMGNSLNYYYQHNTQGSVGAHTNHFTVMEVII